MYDIQCSCGRLHYNVKVLPVYCRCGNQLGEGSEPPIKQPPKPRSFTSVLHEVIGCNCVPPSPRETLVSRLAAKLNITTEKATTLVKTAIKLHERLSTQATHHRTS